jgi:hypothetical protein
LYATPHNIQRETPQNASCDACHGNPDIFLTADKVYEEELVANESVIVTNIPAPVDDLLKPQPEDHVSYTTQICLSCHTAEGDISLIPETHSDYSADGCENCHAKPES